MPVASLIALVRSLLRVCQRAARRPARNRQLIAVTGILVLTLPILWTMMVPAPGQPDPARPLAVGYTFSQRQTAYLTLPWDEVFDAALDLSPTFIRLGAYWDEIEPLEGVYEWSTLDDQLTRAEARGLRVILTVGMKAPRWPEYFLPTWLERKLSFDAGGEVSKNAELQRRTLAFVERVVRRYQNHHAITHWQVENEPLDPSGPHRWQIGADFLAQEVALVRQLDHRPVVVTMFVEVNPMLLTPWRQREIRAQAATLLGLGDVLGLDLYPSRGFRTHSGDWYLSWPAWVWKPMLAGLQRQAQSMDRGAWIMEAQAEPWEPGKLVYTDAPASRSVRPGAAAAAIQQLQRMGFDTILLWGVEHWYMRRARHQDAMWWNQMLLLFPITATAPPAAGTAVGPPA